jgi:hypothetical protein
VDILIVDKRNNKAEKKEIIWALVTMEL